MYVAQKIDKNEIYQNMEKQVGCTRMDRETELSKNRCGAFHYQQLESHYFRNSRTSIVK